MSCRVAAGRKCTGPRIDVARRRSKHGLGKSSPWTGRKQPRQMRAMRKREEGKRKRVPVAGTQMRCRLVGSNQKKGQRACRGRVEGGWVGGGGGEERGLTACEERSRREKAVAGQREERSATRCKSAEQQGRASGRRQRAEGRRRGQTARRRRKSGPGCPPPVWCWTSAIIAVGPEYLALTDGYTASALDPDLRESSPPCLALGA